MSRRRCTRGGARNISRAARCCATRSRAHTGKHARIVPTSASRPTASPNASAGPRSACRTAATSFVCAIAERHGSHRHRRRDRAGAQTLGRDAARALFHARRSALARRRAGAAVPHAVGAQGSVLEGARHRSRRRNRRARVPHRAAGDRRAGRLAAAAAPRLSLWAGTDCHSAVATSATRRLPSSPSSAGRSAGEPDAFGPAAPTRR